MTPPPVDFTHPAAVKRRLFIGNVTNSDEAQRTLMERFQSHGKVEGLMLNRGFGFAQFESEEVAKTVLECENGIVVKGKKIELKAARVGGRGPGGVPLHSGQTESPNPQANKQEAAPPAAKRGHSAGRGGSAEGRGRGGSSGRGDSNDGRGRRNLMSDGGRGRGRGDCHDGNKGAARTESSACGQLQAPPKETTPTPMAGIQEPPPLMRDWHDRDRDMMSSRSATLWDDADDARSRFLNNREMAYREKLWGHYERGYRGDGYDDYYAAVQQEQYMEMMAQARANVCEIVTMDKTLRAYAEYVESRVKNVGLFVDILFAKGNVPMDKAVRSIKTRGVFYAILVNTEHEQHRSVTLYILRGRIQVHKNMLLDDAIKFMARDYEKCNLALHEGKPLPKASGNDQTTPPAPSINLEAHPEHVRQLIDLFIGNKPMTVLEYDRLQQYIKEKRDRQLLAEPDAALGTTATAEEHDEGAQAMQQLELQQRILNILNSGSFSAGGAATSMHTSLNMSPAGSSMGISNPTATSAPQPVPPPTTATWSQQLTSMPNQSTKYSTGAVNQQTMQQMPSSTRPAVSNAVLDSPTFQRALDSLIRHGPNFLKGLSQAQATTTTTQPTQAGNAHMGRRKQPIMFNAYGSDQPK